MSDAVQRFYQEHPDFRPVSRASPEEEHKPFYSIDRIKELPILNVLEDLYGIQAERKGNRYWCAIRGERTPSCCIYPNNSWCDFGDGDTGGDVIKLVQVMDGCGWYKAVSKLADTYHIAPENNGRPLDRSLSDRDWFRLGIYPDMATKNMDIDLDRFSLEQVMSYTQRYRMSMNELRKQDPAMYHRILKDRVLRPLTIEIDDYYASVLSEYEFAKAVGGEDFAHTCSYDSMDETAKELNRKMGILRRAVDDKNAVKVPKIHLSPASDLSDILDGKIRFQTGETPYFELYKAAHNAHQNLFFVKISHADYQQISREKEDVLRTFPCSVFYRGGVDTLCCMGKDLAKLRSILGPGIISVTQRAKDDGRAFVPSKNRADPQQNRAQLRMDPAK